MIGVNLECSVKSVKVKVKEKDGHVTRRCRVTLSRDLDQGIARKLGGDNALAVLDGLKSGGIEQAKIPITAVHCIGEFEADSAKRSKPIAIDDMSGVAATCRAPKDEDDNPTVDLEFEFPWDTKAWAFLGENCSSVIDVLLTKKQTELDLAEGED